MIGGKFSLEFFAWYPPNCVLYAYSFKSVLETRGRNTRFEVASAVTMHANCVLDQQMWKLIF